MPEDEDASVLPEVVLALAESVELVESDDALEETPSFANAASIAASSGFESDDDEAVVEPSSALPLDARFLPMAHRSLSELEPLTL